MDDQAWNEHVNETKSKRYRTIAIVSLLLAALLIKLGWFVFWISGGIAGYFAFLSFFYQPRLTKPKFSNSSSKEKSTDSDFSTGSIRQKVKKVFQIGAAALVFIFVALFIIGSLQPNDTNEKTFTEAGSGSKFLSMDDPNDVDALTSMGNQFYNEGKFDSAVFYYNRILSIDARNTVALYNAGLVYYDQKSYLKSIEVLRTCLQIDASNKDANYVMGHNYYDQGKYDEAFTWYNRAYEAGLRDAFLSHALGYLYDEQKHNTAKAIPFYKEALEMDSSRVSIYTRLAELEPSKVIFYKKKEAEWTK
jgi:tetratricopeptide (TPR) repeat protein